MKKFFISLALVFCLAVVGYGMDNDFTALTATTTSKTKTFSEPARAITFVASSQNSAGIAIAFNADALTGTTVATLDAGESLSFTFDFAQISYGLKKFGYMAESGSQNFRVFAITD